MNKNIKCAIPKWRFESFDSYPKWDIKKLGCLMEPIKERAGDKKYVLMSVTSGVGLIPQVEKFGREIAGNSYKNYYVIRKNDFAYNKSSTKEFPEGYISMLKEYEEAAIPNSIFTCFRVIGDEYEPLFFDQLFNTNYHGKWLRKYIEIGARAHGALSIDTKYLWNMPVAVPKLPEQQKIADCLSSIDDLISAEEKKLSLLNDYKKGWMQKLFPAEGKTVPEWRFPEFKDSEGWEKLNIKKACYPSYSGGTPVTSKKEYYNGDIPFIRSGEIGKEKTELFLTSEGLDNSSAKMIEKGDVLMALYGANSGDVAISPIKGAINQAILCLRHKNNNAFLYHYLAFKKNWIVRTYIQGGQGNLSGEIVKSIELCSPQEPDEQNRIAAFLSVIDDLTSNQKEKIEALKQHKTALMQGLFPSIEEVWK